MAKLVPDAIIDTQLDAIEGTHIAVCSGEPANYAAIAGLTLAGQAISGAVNKAAGDVSGRKLTYPAQTDISITSTGTANHVAIHNNSDTLYSVTTTSADQALTSGGTVSTSAYDHEVNDPS